MVEGLMLIVLINFLFYMMSYKKKEEKDIISPYECGFNPKSESRSFFSYRFFLISILFLIFDVEISLMLAIPFMKSMSEGLFIFLMFVLVLLSGTMYEYYCGSLEWLK